MKIKITKIHIIAVIVLTLLLFCLTSCNESLPKSKTISIKAAIVYKSGVQPVSRTKFYLLKEELKSIRSAYIKPLSAKTLTEAGASNVKEGIQENKIKDSVVATTSTDFEGNAKFENIPSGTYYIAGYAPLRNENGYAVWSVKVEAENVKDVILLDQNNTFDINN